MGLYALEPEGSGASSRASARRQRNGHGTLSCSKTSGVPDVLRSSIFYSTQEAGGRASDRYIPAEEVPPPNRLNAEIDDATVGMLAAVPILSTLSDKFLKRLAEEGKERRYTAGQRILSQGAKGIGLFLILEGGVEVRSNDRPVATIGPSGFFGEMSLVEDQIRTADVVATAPTRCLMISPTDFWGFLADKPGVVQLLFKETIRRLRASTTTFSE